MLSAQMLTTRGSFKQRARTSERYTQNSVTLRNQQVAAKAHQAMDSFEERLENERLAQFQDYEGLDEAGGRPHSTMRRVRSEVKDYRELIAGLNGNTNGGDSANAGTPLDRSQSVGEMRVISRQSPHIMKPPSPLSFYDYGCVSTKPRSVFAQHRRQLGEGTRPEHRRTTQGFLFPGSHFERGTYGFSVLDPVLLPPRHQNKNVEAPDRWKGDAGDLRPLAAHELSVKRNRKHDPVTSPTVRSTTAHAARAKLAFHHLDKMREEAVIEQARFENGMYEGKWRDPMLDMPAGCVPEASPQADHAWQELPLMDMDQNQVMALRLLYNINSAMRHSRGRFSDLFAKENAGARGVLELEEFLRGLLRLGVYHDGEVTLGCLRKVVSVIDSGFDGRVNLPAIQMAVVAVRNLREEPPPMGADLTDMELWGQRRSLAPEPKKGDYGDAAPVVAVRLNHAHGIYKFQDNFTKFKDQQRLLSQHHDA